MSFKSLIHWSFRTKLTTLAEITTLKLLMPKKIDLLNVTIIGVQIAVLFLGEYQTFPIVKGCIFGRQ